MLPLIALFLVVAAAVEPLHLGDLPMQNPDLFEGDIVGVEDRNDRNAVSDPALRWPGGRVPYAIDVTLGRHLALIKKAMEDYHQKTCIRFAPKTTENDYVRMFKGHGCYSHVGRIGGAQELSLGTGCDDRGIIIHELGHAIGFDHEQNRSDRDDYLIIYWENIQPGLAYAFQKMKPSENIIFNTFDTDSIMLYGELAFSKDGRSKTMVAKSGQRLKEVYEKPGLSKSDVERIQRLYKC